jgi:hypothetical protein
MMIVKIDIDCYDRELLVMFDEKYSRDRDKIRNLMESAYDRWTHVSEIEDEEDYLYVHDSCCEEYIVDRIENEGYEILNWDSIEYEEE